MQYNFTVTEVMLIRWQCEKIERLSGGQWCMAQSGGRGIGAICNWRQSAPDGIFLAGGIKTCMRRYFWRKPLRIRVAWLPPRSLSLAPSSLALFLLQNRPRPIQERFILYVIAPPPCAEESFYEWNSEGRRVGGTETGWMWMTRWGRQWEKNLIGKRQWQGREV